MRAKTAADDVGGNKPNDAFFLGGVFDPLNALCRDARIVRPYFYPPLYYLEFTP